VKAERLLFVLLLLLLAWAPLPLGSNRPWAWTVLELACFALAVAWITLWVISAAPAPVALRRAWPAFAALGAWLGEQALHLVPQPAAWVAALSPEAARMHASTAVLGIANTTMTLSVDPAATRAALLKGAAYACLFLLVLALVRTRSRLLLLARVLVYWAVALAVAAVLLHLAGMRVVYFGAFVDHAPQAVGPYVNRNHFAGYLEMTLAIGIGLLIAALSDRRYETWKRFLASTLEWILSSRMVLRLALCILVIALTTTHSRMGNGAFFSSLLVAGAIGIALSRHATRNTVVLLVSLMIIDLAIVGSWFGVEKLAQRMQETTMQDVESREEPAAYALAIVKDYPVFGAGPGSFYAIFPRYRPETVRAFYDHAHNDYVEIAAESGLIGLAILGVFGAMSLWAALRAQWQRRDPLMRGMSFACTMGVTSILIHSWVDFNLQIPANAAYFMVLLALGWISLHLGRE
jgi:O-antigen ligase